MTYAHLSMQGTPPDPVRAFTCYLRAVTASVPFVPAFVPLGHMYALGNGTLKVW